MSFTRPILTALRHQLRRHASVSRGMVVDHFTPELSQIKPFFPTYVNELSVENKIGKTVPSAVRRLKQAVEYTVPSGYHTVPPCLFVRCYNALTEAVKSPPVDVQKVAILAWCIQGENTALLMCDDFGDNSHTRNEQPAWHTLNGIGPSVIYDALLMEYGNNMILRKYLLDHPGYRNIMELFTETHFRGNNGQLMDAEPLTYDKFTMDNYATIAYNKATFGAYVLPFRAAVYLSQFDDRKFVDNVEEILVGVGEYLQIKNDYRDFRGLNDRATSQSSAYRTDGDIRHGKQSWLAIKFLEIATREQTRVFARNFGVDSAECEEIVRGLYVDADVTTAYERHLNALETRLKRAIDELEIAGVTSALCDCLKCIW